MLVIHMISLYENIEKVDFSGAIRVYFKCIYDLTVIEHNVMKYDTSLYGLDS